MMNGHIDESPSPPPNGLSVEEGQGDGNEEDEDILSTTSESTRGEEEQNGMRFSPSMTVQRYMFAAELLSEESETQEIKKIVDFGCSEGRFLKRLERWLREATEIIGVDLDIQLLQNEAKWHSEPLPGDIIQPRPVPLDLILMHGNVGDQDNRLKGTDALTAIEIIEHLHEDTLYKFKETVFDFIRPKVVIVSTPNADFNVLFPARTGNRVFRHWDHKFEWSRAEFQVWCTQICESYPMYCVSFTGVGDPPDPADFERCGHCSQIAVFRRKEFRSETLSDIPVAEQSEEGEPYKIVVHHKYPGPRFDPRSREQRILDSSYRSLSSSLYYARNYQEDYDDEEPYRISINELIQLDQELRDLEVTAEELRLILQESDFGDIEDTADGPMVVFTPEEAESTTTEDDDSPECYDRDDDGPSQIEDSWD